MSIISNISTTRGTVMERVHSIRAAHANRKRIEREVSVVRTVADIEDLLAIANRTAGRDAAVVREILTTKVPSFAR